MADAAGHDEGGLPDDDALDALSFEQLMDALEDITGRLAQGDIGIEVAADLYEQAEQIHARAAARLAQVQDRVARLSERVSERGDAAPSPDPLLGLVSGALRHQGGA